MAHQIHHEESTIDPLHLALRGKTTTVRVWWSAITVIDIIALIGLITLLVFTYQSSHTRAETRVIMNQSPFPAVTFCNINPYKKSALALLPSLADLVSAHQNISRYDSKANLDADAVIRKRDKRQLISTPTPPPTATTTTAATTGCACSYSGGSYNQLYGSIRYIRWLGMSETWRCSYTCCNRIQPYPNTVFRIAPIESNNLTAWLISKGFISSTPAWCGLNGNNASYYWYNSPNTSVGNAVNVSSLCDTCQIGDPSTWPNGGPVTIKSSSSQITFENIMDDTTKMDVICQYTTIPSTLSTSGTNCTTTTTSADSSSAKSSTISSGAKSSLTSSTQITKTSSYTPLAGVTTKCLYSSTAASTTMTSSTTPKPTTSSTVTSNATDTKNASAPVSVTSRCIQRTSTLASTSVSSARTTTNKPSSSTSTSKKETSATKSTQSSSAVSNIISTIQSSSVVTTLQSAPTSTTFQNTPTSPTTFPNTPTLPQSTIPTSSQQATERLTTLALAESDLLVIESILNQVKSNTNALSATAADAAGYLVALLPPDVAVQLGYSVSEVIVGCIYNEVPCYLRDFKLKLDPNYGNCYTFNAKGDFALAEKPGARSGLSVTYKVGQEQYLDYTQAAGVRVVIHDQNEPIFTDAMGFNAPTGYQSFVSMAKIDSYPMPSSTKPCAYSPDDVPVYNYNDTLYVTEACMRSCYQQQVLSRCQCGDPRVPLPKNSNVGYCDLARRDCVNDNYDIGGGFCKSICVPECHVVDYDITQTITKYAPLFKRNMHLLNFNASRDLDEATNIAATNELSKVNVYYSTFLVVEYREKVSYGLKDLLWDVSSIVGLALGMSVISLFEIIKLITWCRKKCIASVSVMPKA